jgi:hypothetical protein
MTNAMGQSSVEGRKDVRFVCVWGGVRVMCAWVQRARVRRVGLVGLGFACVSSMSDRAWGSGVSGRVGRVAVRACDLHVGPRCRIRVVRFVSC